MACALKHSYHGLYCYSCSIYFETCSPFGWIFIDFKHFSSYWISFKQKKRLFFSKPCSKILQKQLLANKIKICSSYIYCALSATLKFNFELLFDLIKIFKEYLKQTVQNSLRNTRFYFLISTATRVGWTFAILWFNTRHSYHCNGSSFGFLFGENWWACWS